ncbi:nucleotidyltransferase domain-containing protein [Paenibacillus sp. GSMTC-2017]|uniref:nucleotidyltransferase domain-containing protein n=1 Tax=Paenibacillus sp. GSMTC-2017 TaxID=2794350 RepID=UPI0018D8B725|nr:nucleotidyltransferase domain-containing protein [Paenibacillus sp. GSMTC-2017]MBH5320936.1 nucleotidyltransferase domain-containing protein [Paenibacillus sp. GSMTC-2017]
MDAHYTIAKVVDSLKQINGVNALVLGGSRARGTENPLSDIDIGIYYDSDKGLDIDGLRRITAILDDDQREDIVTDTGSWGPWINGGGWLKVNQLPVDLLYRDQNKVLAIIDQSLRGEITIDYQPGHPHGFINSIYFAELALCKVLWDPLGLVKKLKGRALPYPPVFQKAIINKFLWEATFSLQNGGKGIYKTDLSYIAGCCFRAVSCLNQVLFALNETYWMNEKGAYAIVDSFVLSPSKYANRINHIFALVAEDQSELEKALDMLRDLISETDQLVRSKVSLN